jgi:hypothetical protein
MLCTHFLAVCRLSLLLVGCCLCCAETFSLMPLFFSIFVFVAYLFSSYTKYSADLCHRALFPFSSSSFIVSGPISKSLVYFWVDFSQMPCFRDWLSSACGYQFPQHHLLNRMSFSHCFLWACLSKISSA